MNNNRPIIGSQRVCQPHGSSSVTGPSAQFTRKMGYFSTDSTENGRSLKTQVPVSPENSPIIQSRNLRWLNLATYVVVGIMYFLGARQLAGPGVYLIAALLCVAFGLLHAFMFHLGNFNRHPGWYFAVQTMLVTGLLALRSNGSDFFGFLFFLLSIQAALVFPARTAAAWIGLFYGITSLSNFWVVGTASLVSMAFNIAAFFLCGVLGHSLRQTELARRHNQQLLEELKLAQSQLQELMIAEERNRIAREIHDGLGHYLTATTMQIQGARALLETTDAATQAPTALGALGKAETLLQEALADVRRSVAALRIAPTDNRPLTAVIGDMVAECRAIAGLEAHFDLHGTPRSLNPQVELTLYRVAQEGLTNVRKHAQAGQVNVVLGYDQDKVGLTIEDDGQGIGAGSNGYGLLGLRERVQLVGGTIDIRTAPNQGCRLEVEIPA
jgi:signal transduction histidine kinase